MTVSLHSAIQNFFRRFADETPLNKIFETKGQLERKIDEITPLIETKMKNGLEIYEPLFHSWYHFVTVLHHHYNLNEVVRPRLLELSEQIQKLATRLNKEEFSSALQQTFKEVTAHIKTKLENIKKQETDAILIAEQAASCLNFDKNILEFVEKVEESPHCNKVADILGLELVAFKKLQVEEFLHALKSIEEKIIPAFESSPTAAIALGTIVHKLLKNLQKQST